MSGIVLSTWNTSMNKAGKNPRLRGANLLLGGDRQQTKQIISVLVGDVMVRREMKQSRGRGDAGSGVTTVNRSQRRWERAPCKYLRKGLPWKREQQMPRAEVLKGHWAWGRTKEGKNRDGILASTLFC